MTGSSSGIFRIPKEVQCFRYVQEPCVYLKWLNTLIRFYNCFHCTLSVSACNNLFFSLVSLLNIRNFLSKLFCSWRSFRNETLSPTQHYVSWISVTISHEAMLRCVDYEGTTPWTLFKGLKVKGLIIINFLLVLSMLHWKEWSQESNNWSHLMNLIDTWTTSPRYVYRKCIRTIKNLNFDIKV